MKRLLLLVCLLTCSLAYAQRLPKDAVPSHYTIKFKVDLAAGTFAGDESIQLRLVKASPTITLNSVGLNISDVAVPMAGRKIAGKVEAKAEQEMVTFQFPENLPAGAVELHFTFAAPLRNDLRGLYKTMSARR